MLAYLVRRIAWAGVLFLAITMVTFILFFVLPVSDARFVRHGSRGASFDNRQDVGSIVAQAAPVTLSLVIGGAIVWMLIAIPVGVLSAVRPRSLLDRVTIVGVLVGISAHPIWIGLMLS